MTQTAIIVGVGALAGVGAASARRFAREGFHVVCAGRTREKLDLVVETIAGESGSAEAVVADATREADILALFRDAMRDGREAPSIVVFNAGINARIPFRDVTAEQFEEFWRVCCLGGFLVGREAARHLVPLGRGTVIFTGASASLRGKDGFAHFAAAKAGLRMIAQSMAREFGPQGLHVAHAVIDGGIDGEKQRSRNPDVVAARGPDGMLDVDAIAEIYWQIHRQPRSAWTQEIDLRPFKESF